MQALVEVILPVFLVIGFGYSARWRNWLSDEAIEGLMRFAQNFALPCLLFVGIARLDLGQNFDLPLLVSFYTGALAGFFAGLFGARYFFRRPWEDSVAIGFAGLFSNSLLLGLAITERAYGLAALGPNYAIIALHAPVCYGIGVTAMEIARNRGQSPRAMGLRILRAMFRNAFIVGILAGLAVNLTGLPIPQAVSTALDLMVRAALPVALFGLGGVLYRYRPEGDLRTIFYLCTVSLILHPLITWTLGLAFGLSTGQLRSAVLTAAMAPGINAYLFANLYGVARRVAASTVLLATALSILTIWGWLAILP
jgi:predicted permease